MEILNHIRRLLSLTLLVTYIIYVFGSDDDTLPDTCHSEDPPETFTPPESPEVRVHSPLPTSLKMAPVANPFPFLSLGENGKVIAETYPMTDNLVQDISEDGGSNLQCYQTYSISSSGSQGTIAMELRSQGYPSDAPGNTTSITCFKAPDGWKIKLTCEEFLVACGQSHFGISFDLNLQSHVKIFCGEAFDSAKETAWSNKLAVVFVTGGGGEIGTDEQSSAPSNRFKCQVHVASRKKEPIVATPPPGPNGACECDQRNALQGRIIGGTAANPNEFPWRCFLFTRQDGMNRHRCGCSLISRKWVLTAAHCVIDSNQGWIVLGGHELNLTSVHMATATSRRFIMHPGFKSGQFGDDIALIELDEPISFSDKVAPICLPWKLATDDFKGCTIVTSGWGFTSLFQPGGSPILNKVNMRVLTNFKCAAAYNPGVVQDSMICGYENGTSVWKGDSGGSMDLQRDGRYYVVGVTAFVTPWDNSPSVFTRVTSYLDWIQSTTNEQFCRQ